VKFETKLKDSLISCYIKTVTPKCVLIIFSVSKVHLDFMKVTVVPNRLMKLQSCNMILVADFRTCVAWKIASKCFRCPFDTDVETVPIDIQIEFIELQND